MFDGQTPGERSATDIMTSAASLTLQVGSLYASGATSTFTGTGGPFGYSPFTSQFGGVITSAGLANEPFADTVYNVAAGDEVIFVLAVQNLGGSRASGVTLKATLPTGFALLSSGLNLTVIDGTGTDLATTGDLFSSGGLQVGVPIAAYDANSGLNVTLVTYSLVATQALPGPQHGYSGFGGDHRLCGWRRQRDQPSACRAYRRGERRSDTGGDGRDRPNRGGQGCDHRVRRQPDPASRDDPEPDRGTCAAERDGDAGLRFRHGFFRWVPG